MKKVKKNLIGCFHSTRNFLLKRRIIYALAVANSLLSLIEMPPLSWESAKDVWELLGGDPNKMGVDGLIFQLLVIGLTYTANAVFSAPQSAQFVEGNVRHPQKPDRYTWAGLPITVAYALSNIYLVYYHLGLFTGSDSPAIVRAIAKPRIAYLPSAALSPITVFNPVIRQTLINFMWTPLRFYRRNKTAQYRRFAYRAIFTLLYNLHYTNNPNLYKKIREILNQNASADKRFVALVALYVKYKDQLTGYQENSWYKILPRTLIGLFGLFSAKFAWDMGAVAGPYLAAQLGIAGKAWEILFKAVGGFGGFAGVGSMVWFTTHEIFNSAYHSGVNAFKKPIIHHFKSKPTSWLGKVVRSVGANIISLPPAMIAGFLSYLYSFDGSVLGWATVASSTLMTYIFFLYGAYNATDSHIYRQTLQELRGVLDQTLLFSEDTIHKLKDSYCRLFQEPEGIPFVNFSSRTEPIREGSSSDTIDLESQYGTFQKLGAE